ncbi:MAG: GTP-binding protein [Promethearchaeota archaeon]|nr:MAG: GTP-binding protein [Candidatus Lokiarchaeota archaeon]
MIDSRFEYRFKIAVIGDGRVGKTSLITRFTKGGFQKDYIKTIGAQLSMFDQEKKGHNIKIIFWDIAGQDDFNFFRPSFFKNSKAAIVVYSLEDNKLGENSFKHIKDWCSDIEQHCENIPIVLFANKVDLIDKTSIDEDEIQDIVKKHNFLNYYVTSAKTGEGVISAFNALIDTIYYRFKELSTEL